MQVEQKEKERKKKKEKEKCAYMCKQSLPRQAQVTLTATMHDVGIRCVDLRLVALPTALYLQRYPVFLSFEVRDRCDSAVDLTGKKVVSVVVVFKIEIARDFYMKQARNQHFLGVFVDFSVARGELPPPRHGYRRLLASPQGIKLSLRTCHSNSVSFHFTQTFPEKVLVFSSHALLKSFAQST